MNRRLLLLTLAVLLLAAAGCSPMIHNVETTYNRSVDFSALKTYGWWSIQGMADTDVQDLKQIRTLIDKDLQAKGLRMVEENPDFLVVVLLRKHQAESKVRNEPATGWWYDQTTPIYWGVPLAWRYEEGTLLIDFVRPKTNHMVWRGTAVTDLEKVKTPEEQTEFIEKAIHLILAKFPPA